MLSPKDARSAVDAGVDGLVLSNHGGRQLDHSPAPLDMIASVRRAIGHRVPLLMDGGIRRGTDVLKVKLLLRFAYMHCGCLQFGNLYISSCSSKHVTPCMQCCTEGTLSKVIHLHIWVDLFTALQ